MPRCGDPPERSPPFQTGDLNATLPVTKADAVTYKARDKRRHAAQLPLRVGRTAKVCGYPERFAQEALGHNSKAVHRAYAKRALMKLPSLDDYERKMAAESVIVPLRLAAIS